MSSSHGTSQPTASSLPADAAGGDRLGADVDDPGAVEHGVGDLGGGDGERGVGEQRHDQSLADH